MHEIPDLSVTNLVCKAKIFVAIAPVNPEGSAQYSTASPIIYDTDAEVIKCAPSGTFDSATVTMSDDIITITIVGASDGASTITGFDVKDSSDNTCTATFVSDTEFTISYAGCFSSTPGSYTIKVHTKNAIGQSSDENDVNVHIITPKWTDASKYTTYWGTQTDKFPKLVEIDRVNAEANDLEVTILFDGANYEYTTTISGFTAPAWEYYAVKSLKWAETKTNAEWITYFAAADLSACKEGTYDSCDSFTENAYDKFSTSDSMTTTSKEVVLTSCT